MRRLMKWQRTLIMTGALAAGLLGISATASAQFGNPFDGRYDPFNKNNKIGGHIEVPGGSQVNWEAVRLQNLRRELARLEGQVREATTYQTNRGQVKASLYDGNGARVYVGLGKELDHQEYYLFANAVGASIVAGNPGPAAAYLEYLLVETKRELIRTLGGEGRRFLQDVERDIMVALDRAIRTGQASNFYYRGMRVDVGIATYNHWKKISGHYPKIDRLQISWGYAERVIPLPNTHQPFVRIFSPYGVR
jgi:hypothetical protein